MTTNKALKVENSARVKEAGMGLKKRREKIRVLDWVPRSLIEDLLGFLNFNKAMTPRTNRNASVI